MLTRRPGWRFTNLAIPLLPRLFRNVETLHRENWMRAQAGGRSIPGTSRIREAKLLLVGSEDDFKGDVAGEMLGVERSHIAGRSATLLGALARLDSEGIDVVLLSY